MKIVSKLKLIKYQRNKIHQLIKIFNPFVQNQRNLPFFKFIETSKMLENLHQRKNTSEHFKLKCPSTAIPICQFKSY